MTSAEVRYDTPVTINPAIRYAVLVLVAGVVLIPLLATALGGFKSLGELRVNPFGLPAEWEWRNYWQILSGPRYWQLMGNSLVIALLTVILTVAAAAMAAFVFVHVRFFGSAFLLNYLLLGLDLPGGDGNPAALHQGPRPRPSRHLLGRGPAAGRLRPRRERASVPQRLPPASRRICSRRR